MGIRNFALVCCLWFTFAAGALNPRDALSQSNLNKDWHFSGMSEATFVGSNTDPCIVFKKDSVRASIDFTVDSDVTELVFRSGEDQVAVPAPKARGTTISVHFDADPEQPKLLIDSAEQPSLRGKWIRLCTNRTDEITLSFSKATYANITFARNADAAAPATAPSTSPAVPLSQAIESAPVDAKQSLQRCKRSVFLIQVRNDANETYASGTGFVVSADGYAITNFHVVHGAASAIARFADSTSDLQVELIAVRPEYDLALLRLKGNAEHFEALKISAQEPGEGDDSWALGYPLHLGYTVTKGVVNGVRTFSQLPDSMRNVLKDYSSTSRWVQTDCTINHGNSGGPLINAKGDVVGVNTWLWTEGNNLFFALSAQHAKELLDPKVIAKPTSFAEAKQKYKLTDTSWSITPSKVPHMEVATKLSAAQLDAASAALARALDRDCTRCGGHGTITRREKVGTDVNGTMAVERFENRREQCDKCEGTGKIAPEGAVAVKLILKVTSSVTSVNRKDPKMQESLQRARTVMAKALKSAPVRAALFDSSRATLGLEKIQPGTPVLCEGVYALSIKADEADRKMHAVLALTGKQILLATETLIADSPYESTVLVGGVVAGTTETDGGRRVVVIQNGFMVQTGN